ncbi:MAG: mannose-1-phosphate guanylyltransferase/mannose-6-phosphate isomerase [Methylophilaceae bacterium]
MRFVYSKLPIFVITAENFVETYASFTNISMDVGLAEKANKIAVVPIDIA